MFFIMAVTLYTSRVILEAIGIDDYGIYSVVGGLVVSFSILTRALSGACSRFITFHLGKGDSENLKRVFSTSFHIQALISIIVLFVIEIFGVWFLNCKMNIPADRLYAANWVLQCSIITFTIGLLKVPYEAAIIAYEKMGFYAKLGIIEVILQLLIVFAILHCNSDRLILYSILMLAIALFIMVINIIYCHITFKDCRITPKIEKDFFKEMLSFAGWNFIGTSAGVLKNQGVDLVINIFFGVAVNAGRGIATQVNTAVTKFSQNFMTALNPQITKSYASGDYQRLKTLVIEGSKYSYYLLLILTLPLIIEMPAILKIWLKEVPQDACIFSRLQLANSLISALSSTNIMAMLATGKIKYYQLVVGGLALLNFPISLLLLYLGFPAYITYITAIGLEFFCLYARFYFSNRLIGISFNLFANEIGLRIVAVTTLSIIIPIIINVLMLPGLLRLILVCITSIVWSLSIIYTIGLTKTEQNFVSTQIKKVFSNLRK